MFPAAAAISPATTCGERGGKALSRRYQRVVAQLDVSVVTRLLIMIDGLAQNLLLTMMDLPKSLLRGE